MTAADPLTAPLADVERLLRQGPALVGTARPPAVLVCEDGRTFDGEAFGYAGETFGEAVFNTGMTGYQETLTDPSYHRQVVVMTAPHVGNTGVNDDDPESRRIWVAGFVVRDPARVPSNHRATRALDEELAAQRIVGISGVDTRALTRHLRERGAMRVGITVDAVTGADGRSSPVDPAAFLARVRATPPMSGADLAPDVATPRPYVVAADGPARRRVAVFDLGVKANIVRSLAALGCEVHVLPASSTAADLLAVEPAGVLVGNGPGDPATAGYAAAAVRGVLDAGVPLFGICFGHQVLARALGLGTYKLGFGHRGLNQPVLERATGRVHVTSHNHGFAVAWPHELDRPVDTAYGSVEVGHVALNDGVVEGLTCSDVPAFSVQYHPEAAPGPHDAALLFDRFVDRLGAGRPA